MSSTKKDVVYVDVDDEITSIIDKVHASKDKIVALVLPKRAAMMQSIVNMKLLKRAAAHDKKRIVLITSEANLLPLAGAVGLHVAKTLQSKPAIPAAPKLNEKQLSIDSDEVEAEPRLDENKPIGELAGLPKDEAEEETIEVETDTPKVAADTKKIKVTDKKKGFNRKLKIPDFGKFRTRTILAGLAVVLLIVGWFLAFKVLPRATVTITADNTTVTSDMDFTASPITETVNEEERVLPALVNEFKKTDTEKVVATGEKDNGQKATGEVTLSLDNCSVTEVTVPAGTGVSTNNLTYVTQEDATLESVRVGSQCRNDDFPNVSTETVKVVAQNAGDKYNISDGRTFTVAGYSAVSATNEDSMSGGTSVIVKIISQEDIDKATKAIQDRAGEAVKEELVNDLLNQGYIGIDETFQEGVPTVTSSPKVGEEGSEVTVTSVTTNTMLGIKEDDLKKLLEKEVEGQVDKSKQVILDFGIEDAVFRLKEKKPNGDIVVSFQTVVTAGPQLDADAIKEEVLGKKKGEAMDQILSRPGVRDVTIDYSPFWVYSTPSSANKINVIFETVSNEASADDGQQ